MPILVLGAAFGAAYKANSAGAGLGWFATNGVSTKRIDSWQRGSCVIEYRSLRYWTGPSDL